MVAPTAASDRVFFKAPPTGRGLAGVEDLRARAGDEINKLRGERRDAAQALHKIQSDALGGENCARGTFDTQKHGVFCNAPTVSGPSLAPQLGGELPKCGFCEIQTGDNDGFARDHGSTGPRGFGHGRQGRGVTRANVFGKGGLDGAFDFIPRKRLHRVSLGNGGKQ
jgi:hypothetical protein